MVLWIQTKPITVCILASEELCGYRLPFSQSWCHEKGTSYCFETFLEGNRFICAIQSLRSATRGPAVNNTQGPSLQTWFHLDFWLWVWNSRKITSSTTMAMALLARVMVSELCCIRKNEIWYLFSSQIHEIVSKECIGSSSFSQVKLSTTRWSRDKD